MLENMYWVNRCIELHRELAIYDRAVRVRDLACGERFAVGGAVFVRLPRDPSAESVGVRCCEEGDVSKTKDFHLDDLVYRAPLPPLVKDADPR